MSKPYKCSLYLFEDEESIRVFYTANKESIVFAIDDVAGILEMDTKEVRKYLLEHEYVIAQTEVPVTLGTKIVLNKCITEGGLFHTCLNCSWRESTKINHKAERFMHWITHKVIPSVLAEGE